MSNVREEINEISAELAKKIPQVYDAGKKAEHDAFWDTFQNYGNRATYAYAFAQGNFSKDNFYPKYDIKPTGSAGYLFYSFIGSRAVNEEPVWDLKARLEECGVVLDTSKATSLQSAFYNCYFSVIPTIDLTGVTNASSTSGIFSYGRDKLVTIEKIITKESLTYTNMFQRDEGLKNVTFEGTIGTNISFEDCTKLTKASIKSIMSHLSQNATFTVTLSQTAVNNAFTTEEWQAVINAKPTNVTVSLI